MEFKTLTGGDMWAAFRWIRDLDPIGTGPSEQIAWLTAESEIRDAVSRRMFALDDESNGVSQRRLTNLIVRIASEKEEAWLTAYLHTATTGQSSYARCLAQLEHRAGAWRVAGWHAPVEFTQTYAGLAAPNAPLPDAPEPLQQARASAVHRNPPMDGGRETWTQLRDDVWDAHHWLLDQRLPEPSIDEKRCQLVDELSIRELLSNYAYAHDARDLAWTASVFADDAMLVNERRVCHGNAEVVDMFRGWNRTMVLTFHRFSNPIVRFVPNRPEAWLIAYFHVPHARPDLRHYSYGRYFGRFTKQSGRWQIVDWRIANDARLELPLEGAA
jgi:ketosteroid isomerase-like protein